MAGAAAPTPALEALGRHVGRAVEQLSGDERAALEQRENEGASYASIAAALGRDEQDVPGLLVAARLALHADIRDAAVPEAGSVECERARELLARRQDGELSDPSATAWLLAHTEDCPGCRSARLGMRGATIALRGAARAGVVVAAPTTLPARPAAPLPSPNRSRPAFAPRRLGVVAASLLALIAGGSAIAAIAGGSDEPKAGATRAAPATVAPAAATPAVSATTDAAAERRRRAAAERRRRRAAAERRRRERAASAAPTPAATRTATPTDSASGEGRERARDDERPATRDRRRARRPAPPSGGTQTETRTESGGLGQPEPTPGGVTDACNEESPDCESG